MAIPLPSFITKYEEILAITLWDKEFFCRYIVMSCSFRKAKFRKPCLVSPKKISIVATIDKVAADPQNL